MVGVSPNTVGLVIWPVKSVPEMTYNVSSGTLNPTHSHIHPLTLGVCFTSTDIQVAACRRAAN